MKNCISFLIFFCSKVIHAIVVLFFVPFKKCLFRFAVSPVQCTMYNVQCTYMNFFKGYFLFCVCHFPCRSLLFLKTYICLYIKKNYQNR